MRIIAQMVKNKPMIAKMFITMLGNSLATTQTITIRSINVSTSERNILQFYYLFLKHYQLNSNSEFLSNFFEKKVISVKMGMLCLGQGAIIEPAFLCHNNVSEPPEACPFLYFG